VRRDLLGVALVEEILELHVLDRYPAPGPVGKRHPLLLELRQLVDDADLAVSVGQVVKGLMVEAAALFGEEVDELGYLRMVVPFGGLEISSKRCRPGDVLRRHVGADSVRSLPFFR
jgi:hypothetical protein